MRILLSFSIIYFLTVQVISNEIEGYAKVIDGDTIYIDIKNKIRGN